MKNIKLQKGAISLIIAIILLAAAAVIILFTAQQTAMEHKIHFNEHREQQAFQAAEAGLEHGIQYLSANRSTILDSNDNVVIPTPVGVQNQIFANGNFYSVTYSSYIDSIIKILSIGTSNDNQAQHIIEQLVSVVPTIYYSPELPLLVKGNVDLGGAGTINNPNGIHSILSGGNVTISGAAQTATSDADIYSNATALDTDVGQNDMLWGSMDSTEFFESFFKVPQQTLKALAGYHLIGSGNYTSELNGIQNAIIWIEPALGENDLGITINAGTIVGSEAHPVLLILDGDARINGHVRIYGLIFVIGGNGALIDLNGTADVYGAFISAANVNVKGTLNVTYDNVALNNLENTCKAFGKIAGSWIDY